MNSIQVEKSTRWRCTACGSKFLEPTICECCGSSSCPSCKATNSLLNESHWGQFVSNQVPLPYSTLRKRQNSEQKQNSVGTRKPRKSRAEKIKELTEELNLFM